MRRAAWQLRHIRDKSLIILTSIDDRFILVHSYSLVKWYFKIISRICFT